MQSVTEQKAVDFSEFLQSTHEQNNIPDIIRRWHKRDSEGKNPRMVQSFLVPVKEI